MGQFGIGQPIKRFEDQRLLRGEGRFHNDVNLPGQAHAVIVRSTHAHARIRSIDTAAAARAPGVVAVFTGADLARDKLGTMQMTLKRKRPDGSPMFAPPHRGLSRGPRRATSAIPSPWSSPRPWPRPRTPRSGSGSTTSPCPP